jgi:hypothetical protein
MHYRKGPRPTRFVLRIVAATGAATVLGITACFPGEEARSSFEDSGFSGGSGSGGSSGFSGSSGSGSSSGFSGSSGSSSGAIDATSGHDGPAGSTGWIDGSQMESSTTDAGDAATDAGTDAASDAPLVSPGDASDEGG